MKGGLIRRHRFESCCHHHWQMRKYSKLYPCTNTPKPICDTNLNLKLKPKPKYLTIYKRLSLTWVFIVFTSLNKHSCGSYQISHILHFLEIGYFSNLIKTPLQTCARHRQLTSSQGTLRPLRPCYFGHWESIADDWHRATCGVYLKWKVHGECIYLKCDLHGEVRHMIHILLLPLLLLHTHPTYKRLNQLCHCARTDEQIL